MDILLPQISISPPPPEEPVVEPYSPFSALSPPSQREEEDAFRPVHLTPPPNVTTFRRQPLSPLRPRETVVSSSKGLERERFEALLKASRERNSLVGTRKEVDLRKEITLKAHKTKQDERRARFLSKVLEPPSPTAMLTPKTPPDSPAIFHYSLPSPGLVSPLALFESLTEEASGPFSYGREPWIEKVDFRSHQYSNVVKSPPAVPGLARRVLPSLDQISARLNSQGHVHVRPRAEKRPMRLPQFLANNRVSLRDDSKVAEAQLPAHAHAVEATQHTIASVSQAFVRSATPGTARSLTPLTPSLTLPSAISRERRALDMLSTIKRRTQSFGQALDGMDGDGTDPRKLKWKRHSAPADLMPLHQRTGFEHPILALPGGF